MTLFRRAPPEANALWQLIESEVAPTPAARIGRVTIHESRNYAVTPALLVAGDVRGAVSRLQAAVARCRRHFDVDVAVSIDLVRRTWPPVADDAVNLVCDTAETDPRRSDVREVLIEAADAAPPQAAVPGGRVGGEAHRRGSARFGWLVVLVARQARRPAGLRAHPARLGEIAPTIKRRCSSRIRANGPTRPRPNRCAGC
jgi:hypothetical protein